MSLIRTAGMEIVAYATPDANVSQVPTTIFYTVDSPSLSLDTPIPKYVSQTYTWESDAEPLTVPDLQDSVEQMYARSQAGVAEFNAQRQRNYPTDPTSFKTAKDIAEQAVQVAEQRLKAAETVLSAKLAADKEAEDARIIAKMKAQEQPTQPKPEQGK